MDVNQLPSEVLNQLPGDSGAPRLPYTGIVAPAGQQAAPTAPEIAPNNSAGLGALLTQPQPARPAPGTFAAKLVSAADQLGIPNGPGGWAKSLVGSAVHALGNNSSNVQDAINSVGASLGDASHATDNLKPGQGALSGVMNTLAARNQRLNAQKQQQLQNQLALSREEREKQAASQQSALNTMQMAVHQAQLDRYTKETRDDIYNSNKAASKSREDNGLAVEHGVTETDLQNRISSFKSDDGRHFADKFEAMPTGEAIINGKPVKMYDVVERNGEPVKVTDDEAKFIAANGGPNIAGTTMPNDSLTFLRLQAQRTAAARDAIEAANDRKFSADEKKQLQSDLHTSAVQHAISSTPFDPLEGISQGLAAAQDHINHGQQLLAAAKTPEAQAEAKQYVADAQKELKSLQNVAQFGFNDKERQEHETRRHDMAEEQIKRQQALNPNGGALGNIPQSDGMIKQIADLRAANPSGARVLDKFDNLTQAALMSVAFGDGSVDFDKAFPVRLTKGAPGITAQNAIAVLKQINPNFSEQQYRATANAYKMATNDKNAQAVQSYNNFIQHSAEAVDALTETGRKGPKIWNTVLNKFQNAGYGTDAIRIQSALAPVRGEISLLLSGGYKPGEDEQKVYHTILNDSATPAQISAALQQLAEMGTVRLDNINENYKRVTNKNLPRIIDQKTLDAAKHLGVSPKAYGTLQGLDSNGTIFGSQTPTGANQPNQPAQSVGHQVGDTIVQNGKTFKVTSVDANGKVTGAQ
jgi:hypothetical protein